MSFGGGIAGGFKPLRELGGLGLQTLPLLPISTFKFAGGEDWNL